MKKGISLIVLVITIIVMIIIAGAIIISLNSADIITKADEAVIASDAANAKSELTLEYAKIMLENEKANNDQDATTEAVDKDGAAGRYNAIVDGYDRLRDNSATVTVDATTLAPTLSVPVLDGTSN